MELLFAKTVASSCKCDNHKNHLRKGIGMFCRMHKTIKIPIFHFDYPASEFLSTSRRMQGKSGMV